jgi:diguanylate cyclase (GGDEF)-like protein
VADSSEAEAEGPSGPVAEAERAIERIYALVQRVQDGEPDKAAELREIAQGPVARRWPDVELAALFGLAVAAANQRSGALAAVTDLRRRSEAIGDPVMLAIALGMEVRGEVMSEMSEDPARRMSSDLQLARAAVLLEGLEGRERERARAHIVCAVGFEQRRLWELADEHYAAAEALLPGCRGVPIAPVVHFNRVELHLTWCCALYELGDMEGVASHREAGLERLAVAFEAGLPHTWVDELDANGIFLRALAGEDVGPRVAEMLEQPDRYGEYVCYLPLAAALADSHHGRPGALERAQRGVDLMDPRTMPTQYDLAMCLLAEIEGRAGPDSAAKRYSRHQAQRLWGIRMSALYAMRSLLEGERLRRDHDLLTRDAHYDELTGLANRRELQRYLNVLRSGGVEKVSVILADLDHFKPINDRFGHAAGDAVLSEVAGLLRANVRTGDLAVRQGGDEFLLVLADADLAAASDRAETILRSVMSHRWRQLPEEEAVTMSFGVASGHPADTDEVLLRADRALYRAKDAGGCGVVAAPAPAEPTDTTVGADPTVLAPVPSLADADDAVDDVDEDVEAAAANLRQA